MTNDPSESIPPDQLDAIRKRAADRARRVVDGAARPRDEWDYTNGLPWPYEPADYGEEKA